MFLFVVSVSSRAASAVNLFFMVPQPCRAEEVGFVDLLDSFVEKEEMYMRDGLHLSGERGDVHERCPAP